jgi:hypothetical protein
MGPRFIVHPDQLNSIQSIMASYIRIGEPITEEKAFLIWLDRGCPLESDGTKTESSPEPAEHR